MRSLFVLLFAFISNLIPAQGNYLVKKIKEPPVLDADMSESCWKDVKPVGKMWQYFPKDSVYAEYDTEIYLVYDDKNIYLAAKAYSPGNRYVTPSLRRDYRAGGNDNITFVFDTYHDNTNGFMFGTNPFGVMREALFFNGGTDNSFANLFWDNKWQSKSKIYEGYFICEMIIPLSTLRYKENSKVWNFKSYRFDTQSNETSVLKRMPQSVLLMALGFTVPIEFEYPLKKNGRNISFIPYASGNYALDQITDKSHGSFNIGADAKVAVTSGLNLDLTVNPDFSTVEADRQQVNLTRFDITFPEQRQFFIENSDMFTGFGSYLNNPFLPPSSALISGNQIFSPFFSRKIGFAFDTVTGTNVQTPVVYGARLSGKIDDDWRIGAMNTLTGKDLSRGIKSSNYSVVSASRRVFDRSNIAAIFVNKSVLGHKEGDHEQAYSSVAGLEYNLQSRNNKWQGKVFYHQAFTPSALNDKMAHGASLNYTTNKVIVKWSHEWLGKGFESDAGFVPRNNILHFSPTVGFNKFPKSKIFQRISYGIGYDQYNKLDFGMTDLQAGPFLLVGFQNTFRILSQFNKNYTYLFNDFDALRSNGKLPSLKKDTEYTYYNFSSIIVSDLRKKFTYTLQPLIGQYFNGSIQSMRAELSYRFQPILLASLNVNYNKIKLKEGKNDVVIIGPKLDFTFRKNLYWTTYVQYNSQFDNLNINSRLQWRFAPVSDFFLVYSDNYDSIHWGAKNKAIIAKLTYWLNM